MRLRRLAVPALGVALVAGLYGLSLVSYLLFHTAVELAGVVVAFGVVTLAWNFRRTLDNNYLLVMGVGIFFISLIDLLHTMAYKGMGVFPGYTANLPTQLHIAGRFLQAGTLIAAPLFLGRKVRLVPLASIYAVVTTVLVFMVFGHLFPDCFVEGSGLTPFKVGSEYVIAAAMVAGMGLLWLRRREFDPGVLYLLLGSVGLTIVGGLAFTVYVGVYDSLNLLGHLFRFGAVVLLYMAIVSTGLTRPFDLLFRNLKQSEAALKRERNFIAKVLDAAQAPMLVVDHVGRVIRFNHTCEELTGYSSTEVAGKFVADLFRADEGGAAVHRFPPDLDHRQFEEWWQTRSGDRRLISWLQTPVRDDEGRVEFVVVTGVDVTEQRKLETELKEREERLRVMVESVQTGMVMVDEATHRIVDVNPAAAAMIGLPVSEILGKPCRDFFGCANPGEPCPFEVGPGNTETRLRSASGKVTPVHRTAVTVATEGRVQRLESFVDMSEHKRIEAELRELSMLDDLTGLYNRRGFLALGQKEIDTALKLHSPMALVFVDVTALREVNDRHGHREGDRALKVIASVLREAFRETSLVARLGGDEFAVLVPHTVGASPSMLVNRLREQVEAFNAAAGLPYELHVGAGVARLSPDKPTSIFDLLNQADAMLSVEKRRRALV